MFPDPVLLQITVNMTMMLMTFHCNLLFLGALQCKTRDIRLILLINSSDHCILLISKLKTKLKSMKHAQSWSNQPLPHYYYEQSADQRHTRERVIIKKVKNGGCDANAAAADEEKVEEQTLNKCHPITRFH